LTTRGSLALVLSFVTFVAVALPLDRSSTPAQQAALSLIAWAFLGLALALQPPAIRVQVAGLVVLATILECVGSLIWGAYTYRLENLPLYVPAGHGLFYLSALRAASLPWLHRNARTVVVAVTAGATAWMLHGLVAHPLPDLLGFVTWAIFVRFIVRGRYPLLYAVSFAMTTALELYGTGLGIWHWSPVLPALLLPAQSSDRDRSGLCGDGCAHAADRRPNRTGTGDASRRRYSGCRGSPDCVSPRQRDPGRLNRGRALAARSRAISCAPHARTINPADRTARRRCRSFAGPMGSAALRSARGSVARSAKRFTTSTPPNPQARANPTQRRIVGSSCIASAFDGFSITNATTARERSHRRQSR